MNNDDATEEILDPVPVGNVTAEQGNPAGAAPESVIGDQTPDQVGTPDEDTLTQQHAEIREEKAKETEVTLDRQIGEYQNGMDDEKQP